MDAVELTAAEEQALRAQHQHAFMTIWEGNAEGDGCGRCGPVGWPCPTVKALDALRALRGLTELEEVSYQQLRELHQKDTAELLDACRQQRERAEAAERERDAAVERVRVLEVRRDGKRIQALEETAQEYERQRLTDWWGKALYLSEQLAIANTRLDALAAALDGVVDRCQCGEIGVWRWEDMDGMEYCCDAHKMDHFYEHGPELMASNVQARAALSRYSGGLS